MVSCQRPLGLRPRLALRDGTQVHEFCHRAVAAPEEAAMPGAGVMRGNASREQLRAMVKIEVPEGGRARGTGRQARPAETCSVPRLPADHRGAGGGGRVWRKAARLLPAQAREVPVQGWQWLRHLPAPAPEGQLQGLRRLRSLPSPARRASARSAEAPASALTSAGRASAMGAMAPASASTSVEGAHERSARPAAWRKKNAP